MRREQMMVKAFHHKIGEPLRHFAEPRVGTTAAAQRRFEIMFEELREYQQAVFEQDLVKVADALGDLLYTALGTAVMHGIDLQPVFHEIHRSNMTKDVDPKTVKRAIKGPTYEPPDLATVLLEQVRVNQ